MTSPKKIKLDDPFEEHVAIIMKKDTYRSAGKGVNITDDRVRVVLDMHISQWNKLQRTIKVI